MKQLLTITLLCLAALIVRAQEPLQIGNIEMINLGDGSLFAREGKKKDDKPINGRVRIITGYTTEYIDAGFDKGYADGKWEYYSHNLLSEVMYYTKGLLNGEKTTYNRDGKTIKEKSLYKNGKKTKSTTYYTDGGVERERNFDEDGREHGPDKKYEWQTGKLKAELNYVHGRQVGKQVRYISSNLDDYIEISNYNEGGELDGAYSEIYAENNKDKVRGQYAHDKKDGKWVYTDGNGKVIREEIYNNGNLTESKRIY